LFLERKNMKIENIKKSKKNTYQITIDQKEYLLYDDIIIKYGLLPKKEISKQDLEDINRENKELEAYYFSLKQLEKRLRSKKEINTLLSQKEYSLKTIEQTIRKLEAEGYLNESKYIEAYLNDAFRFTSDGPFKIKRKLLDLGNQEDAIEKELNNFSKQDWCQKLEKLFQKKANSKHNEGIYKWKTKCEIYFYNLGYPKEWIEEISSRHDWQEKENLIDQEYNKLFRKWSRKLSGEQLLLQIKRKLYEKGFQKEQIEQILTQKKD